MAKIDLKMLYWRICKPEYLSNPGDLLREIVSRGRWRADLRKVRLNWGLEINLAPCDAISKAIARHGVHDLVLSESVWRLLERGESALDIGANIGYVTSLMAARIGTGGVVNSFEPHPVIFRELSINVNHWQQSAHIGRIAIHRLALSSFEGEGDLEIPPDFDSNRGGASLRVPGDLGRVNHSVQVRTLDHFLSHDTPIGLAKVDVEKHELEVFKGAQHTLSGKLIRDIVFEDYGRYPTEPMRLLQSFGYTLFALGRRLLGPRLLPPDHYSGPPWSSPNYLATIDPDRAINRLSRHGWDLLSANPLKGPRPARNHWVPECRK